MIIYEIIPGSNELFTNLKNDIFTNDIDIDLENLNDVHVIDINLFSKLLSYDFVEFKVSKETIIKNLLSFFSYLDYKINKSEFTFKLKAKTLYKYFGNGYKTYLNWFFNEDIFRKIKIEGKSYYKIGEYSTTYRITKKYIGYTDYCLVYRKISRPNVKKDIQIKLNKKYENAIMKSYIDYNSYIKAEFDYYRENNISLRRLKIRLNRAFGLLKKRSIKKGENVDRLYHSFSNISRIAKKHLLTPSHDRYNELDISNSQPTFLIAYLKFHGYEIDQNYIDVTESGLLYEVFDGVNGSYLKYDDTTKTRKKTYVDFGSKKDKTFNRDKSKVEFYNSILFHFKEDHPQNIRFKELFPKTWLSLKELHSDKTKTLASELQNFESELIHSIVPRKSKYYFTLHDAIYFSDPVDRMPLKLEIEKKFAAIGIKCTIK